MRQVVVATFDADAPELALLRDALEDVATAAGMELRWQAGRSDDADAFRAAVRAAGADDVLVIVAHGRDPATRNGTVSTGRPSAIVESVDDLLPSEPAAGMILLHVCYQGLPGNIEHWLRKARPGSTVLATAHGSGHAFPRLVAGVLSGDVPTTASARVPTQLPRQWWRWRAFHV